jgi:hypothetical protein
MPILDSAERSRTQNFRGLVRRFQVDRQAGTRVPRVPVVEIFRYDDEQIGAPLFYGGAREETRARAGRP